MELSGAVVIRLPARVAVHRPAVADRLFSGRSWEAVMTLIPMLYSLCAQAQRAAARLALTGNAPDAAMSRQVALEAVREHALYLARWAPALRAALRGVSGWHALSSEALQARLRALEKATGGFPSFSEAENWAQTWPSALRDSVPDRGESHYEKDFSAAVLACMRQDPDWSRRPEVNGVRENSFYARAAAHEPFAPDVAGRLKARLWDLRQWLQVARGGSAAFPLWGERTAGGWRLGWVETARGRLYHAAQVEGERVLAYRISAPTEWNFHPQGVLAQWLKRLPQVNEETALALAQLIDPCVAVRVERAHA